MNDNLDEWYLLHFQICLEGPFVILPQSSSALFKVVEYLKVTVESGLNP